MRRAYTLREMMAYTIYNNESQVKGNLIWDQASTMVNMARWMRQGKDQQFLEYPLNEDGTPTGEELHSTNGFRETDSYVDTIQYPRPIRDTIFSECRSFGLHIFSPFNFERPEPTRPSLEVTKKVGTGIPAGVEWNFTVRYTSGSPASFSAKKNDVDCTSQVTETDNSLKFSLKADETIRIDFEADSSFRYEVTEDDSSQLTNITGTGGTADMSTKKIYQQRRSLQGDLYQRHNYRKEAGLSEAEENLRHRQAAPLRRGVLRLRRSLLQWHTAGRNDHWI